MVNDPMTYILGGLTAGIVLTFSGMGILALMDRRTKIKELEHFLRRKTKTIEALNEQLRYAWLEKGSVEQNLINFRLYASDTAEHVRDYIQGLPSIIGDSHRFATMQELSQLIASARRELPEVYSQDEPNVEPASA